MIRSRTWIHPDMMPRLPRTRYAVAPGWMVGSCELRVLQLKHTCSTLSCSLSFIHPPMCVEGSMRVEYTHVHHFNRLCRNLLRHPCRLLDPQLSAGGNKMT